mmetsp:Transcript_108473/g.307571  ORF Transcript_108473/g.307571 Transcript_108473/m.307571 type:complete len:288 (-) Transcript_108473:152-1015(-)
MTMLPFASSLCSPAEIMLFSVRSRSPSGTPRVAPMRPKPWPMEEQLRATSGLPPTAGSRAPRRCAVRGARAFAAAAGVAACLGSGSCTKSTMTSLKRCSLGASSPSLALCALKLAKSSKAAAMSPWASIGSTWTMPSRSPMLVGSPGATEKPVHLLRFLQNSPISSLMGAVPRCRKVMFAAPRSMVVHDSSAALNRSPRMSMSRRCTHSQAICANWAQYSSLMPRAACSTLPSMRRYGSTEGSSTSWRSATTGPALSRTSGNHVPVNDRSRRCSACLCTRYSLSSSV